MIKKICALSFAFFLTTSVAMAMDKDHSKMDHATMDHGSMNQGMNTDHKMEQKHTEAMGEGVIHSVSKLNRMVNLTHAPIPELNWPEMKMDLAVGKNVDLNALKAGDKVKFHLMLDEDNIFRIHHIEK